MRRVHSVRVLIGIALLCQAFAGSAIGQGAPQPQDVSTTANADNPRDIDGVWWIPGRYDRTFRPVEGGLPPFTERGRREWEHNVRADEAGTPVADAPTRCLPHGIPRLLSSPYPIQIVTTPGQVTWIHEVNRNQRWIYMDEAHPPNLPHTYLGHSVGRWEGDTLVIDTVALNDKTRIDEEGITHSDRLHVVERIRKIEIDGTPHLENLITITDPVMFTRPWTTKRVYKARPDVRIMEYVCEENNRNAPVDGVTVAK